MKNKYVIEYWQYHVCCHRKTFTNKKKAQDWLKKSGWWIDWEYGNCAIHIYKNGIEVNWCQDEGWY